MLQRGDIVIANFGRDARGHEIGNKKTGSGPVRWAVVVSAASFNQKRPRVTLAPIMNYDEEGRELRANWGFWLPKEATASKSVRENESFVDCGQLWTLFSNFKNTQTLPRDVYKCTGKILDRIRLDLALQIVFNPFILTPDTLWARRFSRTPKYGEVLIADLPSTNPKRITEARRVLVISASGVDTIRNQIALGHVTVVPLEDAQNYKEQYNGNGIALVDVAGLQSTKWMANCQEIYTIDWKERRTRVVGELVNDASMEAVIMAVRQYLDLPMPRVDASSRQPEKPSASSKIDHDSPWRALAEKQADAAEHYAKLSIASGLAFRDAQQEAYEGYVLLETNQEFHVHHADEVDECEPRPGLMERLGEVVRLWFDNLSIPLMEPMGAGDLPSFPDIQPLPPDWFSGRTVELIFSQDEAGTWYVERSGTLQELRLTFWSIDGEVIGERLTVAGIPEPVPVESPAQLSRINIEVIEDT